MKEENILKDIKELLILLCKIQLNSNNNKDDSYEDWNTIKMKLNKLQKEDTEKSFYDFVYATKKEDLIRDEYNKRMENNKYFKNKTGIKSIDLYGLITDAIYTRLDIFFQEGEWDDYMLTRIADNIVEEMQEDDDGDD